MNKYRIDKSGLLETLAAWNGFLKRKIHLIACGGTALTLLGLKDSTKDIDLMVPDLGERDYLLKTLKKLGYAPVSGWGWSRDDGFIFDLFKGKSVHTTELLQSPLEKENHQVVKEFTYIYLGVLNYYDLIISKLFRGAEVDYQDCLTLVISKVKEMDFNLLDKRLRKTASFDVSEEKIIKNYEHFITLVKKEGLRHE